MKQRELTDNENIRWTCVQTYTMSEHNTEEKDEADKVAVVCTPSGKEKTVRIDVSKKWEEELTDESLLQMIKSSKE